MDFDPLELFVHEKTGSAQKLLDEASKPRPVTHDIQRDSLDPGARALAGITAVSGSIISKTLIPITSAVLTGIGLMDSTKLPRIRPTTNKLMGLFNIHSKVNLPITKDHIRAEKAVYDIIPSVSAFFESHPQLDRARVAVKIQGEGPLSRIQGPRYHIPKKTVHVPLLSKPIILHELGHAADFTGSTIGKIRGYVGPVATRSLMMALPIALVAGDKIKETLPGTIDDKAIAFMQRNAPEIAGATIASTILYPEVKAWVSALRHLKKTEGSAAVRSALKTAIPALSTYALGTIPAVVGFALARKFMREARKDKAKLQEEAAELAKSAGIISDIGSFARETAKGIANVGRQVGEQSVAIIKEPGTTRKLIAAAKEVGTSPEFVMTSLSTALPAAMGSLYLYGSPAGKQIRSRIAPEHLRTFVPDIRPKRPPTEDEESWREKHPLRFSGLVALGAALSAGVMSKFLSDLSVVL